MLRKLNSLVRFLKDAKTEASRIYWPSRQEVVLTGVFVFFMVMAFVIFFMVVDTLLSLSLGWLLGWRFI